MARSTVRVHTSRIATLLLLVACTVFLLLHYLVAPGSDGGLDTLPEYFDRPDHPRSHILARVDPEDTTWLGYPRDEVLSREDFALGEKGKLVKKGWDMVCKMMEVPGSNGRIVRTPETQYKEYSDLENFGYSVETLPTIDLSRYDKIQYFAQLGISPAPRDWKEVEARHLKSTARYPATNAIFRNMVSTNNRAIIAWFNYGPDFQNKFHKMNLKPDQVVPLKHWSDIMWLKYLNEAEKAGNSGVIPLEHVIRHNVAEEDTMEHLRLITGKRSASELGEFPGQSYSPYSAQGMAVLGTTHGKAVAYLLAQHKARLGVRTVVQINVYKCPTRIGSPQWCIYFRIGPVPR